jgi:hypothetical protein
MAVKALDLARVWGFVSDDDPDKGDPSKETKWLLGALDATIMAHIQDKLTQFSPTGDGKSATAKIDFNAAAIRAVELALRGWTNFKDASGKDVPFETEETFIGGRKYEQVKREIVDRIPLDTIVDIYTEIKSANTLSETEAKNSDTESTPTSSSPSEIAEPVKTETKPSGAVKKTPPSPQE